MVSGLIDASSYDSRDARSKTSPTLPADASGTNLIGFPADLLEILYNMLTAPIDQQSMPSGMIP